MTNLPITGAFSITAVYGQKGKYWANGHKGIDFVSDDRRIFATCDGTVRLVAYDENGWGQYVSIGDNEGRRHIFCHLEVGSVRVKLGDVVNRETVIGTMGATGNVTGTHLHYQLQQGTTVIDPTAYLGVPNEVGKYHSKDFEIKEVSILDKFNDKASVPAWAEASMEKAVAKGVLQGDNLGNLNPNEPVTRAQLTVILDRLGML